MYGINEDIWGSSEVRPGIYIVMAVVAFMVLRATPAFLREVLPAWRLYPVIAGSVAFWWLLLTGRPMMGFLAMVAGMIGMQLLQPTEKGKAPPSDCDKRHPDP